MNKNDLGNTPPEGNLYSFNAKRQSKQHLDNIRISNGIAFNNEAKKIFYTDSLNYTVDCYDYDIENELISNKQVWFTFNETNSPGLPDGMTIDADGNLWVAVFGGSRVIKIDWHKPETLLDTVELPALQVNFFHFKINPKVLINFRLLLL